MSDRRRRQVSAEEEHMWRAHLADVAPLPGRSRDATQDQIPEQAAADPRRPRPTEYPQPVTLPPLPPRSKGPLPSLTPGHVVGLDRRNGERFTRGEFAVEARVDLHGLTHDAARERVGRFLHQASYAGRRCVLIITGKGGPNGDGVLRSELPHWLNSGDLRPLILAFSTALPKHGGGGAVYVLLKRRRGEG